MEIEQRVAAHYGHCAFEQAILDALRAGGRDVDNLQASDLAAVDEFHLGWRPATVEFGEALGLEPGMQVLDVGGGIGGPARYFAEAHGCTVTGIDLTEEFVEVANALSARCRLADRVTFQHGSALAMPFADASFDVATLIHVGMNIQDKATLCREVRRALKPGGRFGVYDIMRVADDAVPYPMPWAVTAETSFVETPATYRRLLEASGFIIESERDRSELALTLGREMRENAAKNGPPILGLHTLMGPATPERLGNVMSTLQRGTIAPIEIIARAV